MEGVEGGEKALCEPSNLRNQKPSTLVFVRGCIKLNSLKPRRFRSFRVINVLRGSPYAEVRNDRKDYALIEQESSRNKK